MKHNIEHTYAFRSKSLVEPETLCNNSEVVGGLFELVWMLEIAMAEHAAHCKTSTEAQYIVHQPHNDPSSQHPVTFVVEIPTQNLGKNLIVLHWKHFLITFSLLTFGLECSALPLGSVMTHLALGQLILPLRLQSQLLQVCARLFSLSLSLHN
jgi:hypothetical protein